MAPWVFFKHVLKTEAEFRNVAKTAKSRFQTQHKSGFSEKHHLGGASAGNQGPHSETSIGGNTTNNVKISVNIDKTGKADASADTGSGGGGEREENEQANQSKEFGKILQGVVLDEIVKQQRPGGLLQANS